MNALPQHFRAVVLDIEGTTTPISFVYDTLFPYAREAMQAHIRAHMHTPRLQTILEQTRQSIAALPQDPSPEALSAAMLWQMDHDRKHTGLKMLQGDIWAAGYRDGTLKGALFDDVPRALEAWTQAGVRCFIYSSGSVAAQKLLFGHSVAGDLRPKLSGYFDTTTGPKTQTASYEAIARALELAPEDVCFLTDRPSEARAARQAGMQVAVTTGRPGNPEVDAQGFCTLESFEGLF